MGVLALATLLLRLPYRARYLNGWDSVLFALGTERYDITAARPHPPGYPVYIALAKILLPFSNDANSALVWVSILASMAAVVCLYGFMCEIGSRRAALVASTLLMVAPVFVFNGVIALSYACEGAASVGFAWLAWRVRKSPTSSRIAALAAVWSIAIGVRQSLIFFLTPLLLLTLLVFPRDLRTLVRRALVCSVSAGLTTLVWFVPMIGATGGFDAWRRATALQSGWVVFSESVFTGGMAAFEDHGTRLLFFLHPEQHLLPILAALLIVVTFILGVKRVRPRWGDAFGWPKGTLAFLAAWLLPSLLFYLLVFDGWDKGPTGYVLVLLPGVYALFAWIGDAATRILETQSRAPRVSKAATLLIVPVLLLPGPSLIAGWPEFLDKEVRAHDDWSDAWAHLPDSFPPNETAILAWYSWAHVKWYFPQYLVWSYLPVPGRDGNADWVLTLETRGHEDDVAYYDAHYRGPTLLEHPVPANIHTIVLFDFQLAGENGATRRLKDDVEVKETQLDNGWRVLYFEPDAAHPTIESYFQPLPNAWHLDQ